MEMSVGKYRFRKTKILRALLWGGLVAGLWFACTRPDLEELDFIEVSLNDAVLNGVDSVKLSGSYTGQNIDSCGFLYAENANVLLSFGTGVRYAYVPVPAGKTVFEGQLPVGSGQTLFFRAFARRNERIVYSKEILSTGISDLVSMIDTARVNNDAAVVYGLLSGLKGTAMKAHGHVYSPVDSEPKIGKPACDYTHLGAVNYDKIFPDTLEDLDFNALYHVRAYVVTPADVTVYSKTGQIFRVRDGWKKVNADLPEAMQDAVGAGMALSGRAYLGFGSPTNKLIWQQNDLNRHFYQFDTQQNTWTAAPDFPGQLRTNVGAFSIEDTLYVLFGEYYDNVMPGQKPVVVKDFRKFDAQLGQWSAEVVQSDLPPRRTGAVAFVLNGKGYLGTGRVISGLVTDTEVSDFYEYNPQTGAWRRVASLPLRTSAADPTIYNAGRQEAAAFAAGGFGYVGGGINGALNLTDFWRFTPPVGSQDSGKWELATFFPGPARVEAVSFAIGDKGYYGTGYNSLVGELDDFWEFTPPSSWVQKTAFKGGRRRLAAGFSLSDKGYAGSGTEKRIINNGNDTEYILHADFWYYTPEK